MEDNKPLSIPLMRVAPMFYKEKTFWDKRVTPHEKFKDIASIDHIDYNPFDLNELLVSSLARVSIYDSNNLEIAKTFKTNTQFQVYGGCFRKNDGRLVAAGSEEGKVFIFESMNTNPLRTFELRAPTHRLLFMDNKLVTFSDDAAVRILDVGSGSIIKTYGNNFQNLENNNQSSQTIASTSPFHQDYIRSGCLTDKLIVSGSYDNLVKFWDPRVEDSRPVMEFNHGHGVESLTTRGDTLLISVGGNKLHVFDMVAGKTLTNIIPRHHKTITCVANFDDKYLLTAALDGYLNIFDFNYEYVTRFNYDEAQILSLSVSPKLVAMGLNNHHIHVKRFKDFIKKSSNEMAELEKLQSGYFGPNMVARYFHEAIAESQDPAATRRAMLAFQQKKAPIALDDVDCLYEPIVFPKLKHNSIFSKKPIYEKLLAGFRHGKALDSALRYHTKDPDGVIYVLQELTKRDKMQVALRGARKLITLMKFISIYLGDIRHNRILLDTALILMDYMLKERHTTQSFQNKVEYSLWLDQLIKTVSNEVQVSDLCAQIGAQLNTIISQY